jgi:hypothetical protein
MLVIVAVALIFIIPIKLAQHSNEKKEGIQQVKEESSYPVSQEEWDITKHNIKAEDIIAGTYYWMPGQYMSDEVGSVGEILVLNKKYRLNSHQRTLLNLTIQNAIQSIDIEAWLNSPPEVEKK